MLVAGSKILVRESTKYLPVENLNIGGFLFDPLADQYCEIVDILSRSITIPLDSNRKRHSLKPIVIKAGAIGKNLPHSNVTVSPFQELFVPNSASDSCAKPCISLQTAERAIVHLGHEKRFRSKTVTYFAIFTERYQLMDVEGLLMKTCCPDLINDADYSPLNLDTFLNRLKEQRSAVYYEN